MKINSKMRLIVEVVNKPRINDIHEYSCNSYNCKGKYIYTIEHRERSQNLNKVHKGYLRHINNYDDTEINVEPTQDIKIGLWQDLTKFIYYL